MTSAKREIRRAKKTAFSVAALPKENGRGFAPPPSLLCCTRRVLAEQFEHRLVRLVGDRQCRDFQLLLGLLGEQVGAGLVLVGQNEVGGASLQRVDHVSFERLPS